MEPPSVLWSFFLRDIEKQIGSASSGVSRVVAKLHLNCIFKLRHIGMELQFVQYEIIIKFARRVYCDTVELQIILLSNNVIKSYYLLHMFFMLCQLTSKCNTCACHMLLTSDHESWKLITFCVQMLHTYTQKLTQFIRLSNWQIRARSIPIPYGTKR